MLCTLSCFNSFGVFAADELCQSSLCTVKGGLSDDIVATLQTQMKETNIHALSVKQVPAADLEKLAALKDLVDTLYLEDVQGATDLAPIGQLTGLKRLALANVDVADLSALSPLTALEHLSLFVIPATDLAPVCQLSGLTRLGLSMTKFTDFASLADCTKLQRLDALAESKFNDLEVLASLPNFTGLFLTDNEDIQEWAPLTKLTNLRDLDVARTSFSDLSLLKEMSGLVYLVLDECTVTHPEVIHELPSLIELGLFETKGLENITIADHIIVTP
jgi:Leucine-rich repeat (LRR) protein